MVGNALGGPTCELGEYLIQLSACRFEKTAIGRDKF